MGELANTFMGEFLSTNRKGSKKTRVVAQCFNALTERERAVVGIHPARNYHGNVLGKTINCLKFEAAASSVMPRARRKKAVNEEEIY